jgi:sugar phosphate isomerase/epimerase
MSQPPDPALLSLNTVTVRGKWSLRQTVDGCARAGIRGISPWRDHLADIGAREAARVIRDGGLAVSSLDWGGMFPAEDRKGRRRALDESRRAIDDAVALEARCLVLAAGGLPPGSRDLAGAREMVRDGIGETLEHARAAGIPLAIEPYHPMYCADRACVNTLGQALDLCDELDRSNTGALGVVVDVYHVWWDPALEAHIARAGEKRLLAFQISDWLASTMALADDRGMMGDGIIDLPLLRSRMEEAGYRGFHEVEILSTRNWWRREPEEVLAICRMRHQSAC